ncbi:MAG: hypothetical protein ACREN7_03890 [Candidatus Dormibacteria bacterium]
MALLRMPQVGGQGEPAEPRLGERGHVPTNVGAPKHGDRCR